MPADLFSSVKEEDPFSFVPLASRLAPRDWNDFVGQSHLVSPGSLLRRAIEADQLTSSIFFGPPGTGKTGLARLAAKKTKSAVEFMNAVTAGVGDIRQVIKRAVERQKNDRQRTLCVIDEIHHFNRTQQDALLPDVERGYLTLIGLTTENPFFYVNAALLSRSTTFEFKPLEENHLKLILNKALDDKRKNGEIWEISEEGTHFLLNLSAGDARRLLNIFELASLLPESKEGKRIIDLDHIQKVAQRKPVLYDKTGDEHYDVASAFIKSMRGSDPDAAVYWLSKMLEAGEDPRFIMRRVMILASEDIGNADPQAIQVASAAANIIERIGMPEARITLAQAVTYMATAPKSNASYEAINKGIQEVRNGVARPVPLHLRDSTGDRQSRGHGVGYKYPHDFPHHYIDQEYMPSPTDLYIPSDQGFEKNILNRVAKNKDNADH